MDWWLLTFLLGTILSLFLPEVPAIFQLFLLLCAAIAFYCHKRLCYSSGFLFGALWILSQAYHYENKLQESFIDLMQKKQVMTVEGTVLNLSVKPLNVLGEKKAGADVSYKSAVTARFNFRVNKVNDQKVVTPFIIRLSWKKPNLNFSQGQGLQLNVKIKPAHGLANIGTFNYMKWLKATGISATGYVKNQNLSLKQKKSKKQIRDLTKNQLITSDITMRQTLFDKYQQLTPHHKLTPILFALAFGERSLLDPSLWQVLQGTGTSHLIAISGLHVGLLASSAFYLVMLIFRFLPLKGAYWQTINIRYVAIFISMLLALLYAYLAGFSLPTLRALLMLSLYWTSRIAGIKLSPKRLILLTVFIVLLMSPFSLLTASFWLSFYAVTIIFLSLWRFKFWLDKGTAVWRFFKGLFIIQISLTVMLIPITALFFQQVSLVSLAANIIAVPWMSMLSIPTTLISVVVMPIHEPLAQWFIVFSLQTLTWLWVYLEMLAGNAFAIIELSLLQQLFLVVCGLLAFVTLYLLPLHGARQSKQGVFILSVALLGTLLFNNANESKALQVETETNNDFIPWKIVFFDVGQGLSVLVTRNNNAILYDTGASYPSGFTLSEAVVLPYLQYLGINTLDKILLSHSDNDHAGGIQKLVDNIEIGEVISNDSSLLQIPTTPCNPSNSFTWQRLAFNILWPIPASINEALPTKKKQKNDDSCVVLIVDEKGHKLLLTGDISRKVERQLLRLYTTLNTDVLQVPHHGSKTSSSKEFIRQLAPQVAVVSAGYLNRWYMPVQSVVQRYHDSNVPLLKSAEVGQVIITINKERITTQNYVDDLRPFWFNR
jgi:competence protein ComEC